MPYRLLVELEEQWWNRRGKIAWLVMILSLYQNQSVSVRAV
jgi:hypothetical protein